MRPRWILAAGLVLTSATAATAKTDSTGWVISKGGKADVVRSKDHYDLLGLQARAFLAVRPGRTGEELTTREKAIGNVQLVTADDGELRCGDRFALKVDGVWIVYGDATPVELVATRKTSPDVYQWKIGNCKGTAPITTNAPIALVNVRVNDALVGCRRPWGAPFCWDEKQQMGTPITGTR